MKWGELPANTELAPLIQPIVTPIIAPIVADVVETLPVVQNDDPRLSDARPPLTHAHAQYCQTDDARLSNARTPLPHTHPQSEVTGLSASLGNKVDTTDSRLSDARTPTPHTHSQADVSGLTTALGAKEATANKGQANGYASLDAGGKVPATQLPVSGGWNRIVLAADVTNNNAVANTLQDVASLSFPVVANQRYFFRFLIIYTAQAITTGSRWTINGPTNPTGLVYMSEYSLTTTTTTRNPTNTAYNLPAASSASSATTGPSNMAEIEGFIQPSVSGSVVVRFASEVAGSAIVAKAGSFAEYTTV